MTRKPTRGPWVAVEVGQGGPADNPMPVYEIQSADGHKVIAEYVDGWNAPLLAAAPELAEEHQQWAERFGEALVLALQGDYSKVDDLARALPIGFAADGPFIKSAALSKALGLEGEQG